MAASCSICLSELTDPACIPCGHIYCLKCISGHVANSTPDGFTASCPQCRAEFPIVSPDLNCLPRKLHRYITPSIRRVYLDIIDDNSDLQDKLDIANQHIQSLQKSKETLMRQCERHMNNSRVHQEGERDARQENMELKEKLQQCKEYCKARVNDLVEEFEYTQTKYENLKKLYKASAESDNSTSRLAKSKKRSSSSMDSVHITDSTSSPSRAPTRRRISRNSSLIWSPWSLQSS